MSNFRSVNLIRRFFDNNRNKTTKKGSRNGWFRYWYSTRHCNVNEFVFGFDTSFNVRQQVISKVDKATR